jgi:hypothetical protein
MDSGGFNHVCVGSRVTLDANTEFAELFVEFAELFVVRRCVGARWVVFDAGVEAGGVGFRHFAVLLELELYSWGE